MRAADAQRTCALRAQVCKVYIGSFNADRPVRTDLNPAGAELFEKEQADLLQDLYDIPQRACDRKAGSLCLGFLGFLVGMKAFSRR